MCWSSLGSGGFFAGRELRWAFSVDPLEPPAASDQLAGVGPWPSVLWPDCRPGGGDGTRQAQAVRPEPVPCRAVEFRDPGSPPLLGGFHTAPGVREQAPLSRSGPQGTAWALPSVPRPRSALMGPTVSILHSRGVETSEPLGRLLRRPARSEGQSVLGVLGVKTVVPRRAVVVCARVDVTSLCGPLPGSVTSVCWALGGTWN